MRPLLFIRHAQSIPQPNQPPHAWPLTAEGEASCQQLAACLASHPITRIVTSTELKARETGRLAAEALCLPWETAADLQEQDNSGLPYFEQESDFQARVAQLLLQPEAAVFGRESGLEARDRFSVAVDGLLGRYPNDVLALVSHGRVLTLFLAPKFGLNPLSFWQSLSFPAYIIVTVPNWQLVNVVPRLPLRA